MSAETEADAKWLRSQLQAAFGHGSQTHFARFLKLAGDRRPLTSIVRSISNAVSGRHRLSGEMRALAWLLTNHEAIPDLITDARLEPEAPTFKIKPPPKVSAAPPKRR